MNDPVDRVIEEREGLESGFRSSLVLSVIAHVVLVGGAFAAQLVLPKPPPIRVVDGIAVPMPPGGRGTPSAEPPAPAAEPQPEAPQVEPPPKVLKPPKEEPRPTKGLPAPDAKRGKSKPEPAPARGGVPAGKGPSAQTPGLEFAPPGPGVPGGTDPLGDWYTAGVKLKIYLLWAQQVPAGTTQPIKITFTILADGNVTDMQVVQKSGVFQLDQAAQRAILGAAPFGPLPKDLPKDYGTTNRYTLTAIFKPTN